MEEVLAYELKNLLQTLGRLNQMHLNDFDKDMSEEALKIAFEMGVMLEIAERKAKQLDEKLN